MERRDKKQLRGWVAAIALRGTLASLLYLASAGVVFDFSRPAPYTYEREDDRGKRVAFGPHPRWPFGYGGNLDIPGGWDFTGEEPVFVVYRPVCELWRRAHGYALPTPWRPEPERDPPSS